MKALPVSVIPEFVMCQCYRKHTWVSRTRKVSSRKEARTYERPRRKNCPRCGHGAFLTWPVEKGNGKKFKDA